MHLCDECFEVESGRHLAGHLRDEYPNFPKAPTDEDYRRFFLIHHEWLQSLGEEFRQKQQPPDAPSA